MTTIQMNENECPESSYCTDNLSNGGENGERHSAVWTSSSTTTLLKLYSNKLEMLETPKKKTRIWIAVSEGLKHYNIEMSPDQVRWKINALTKKYKQCLENGHNNKFKYFNEMDMIHAQCNVDCDPYTMTEKKDVLRNLHTSLNYPELKLFPESRAMVEMRKLRLANRIESIRSQSKINLEKQWLEYLRRKEGQSLWRDDIYERHLKLREEEIELRKRELEMKETLEIKKLELIEKEQEELLQIEKEKCEILHQILVLRK